MSAITPEWAEQIEETLPQLDPKLDQILHDLHKIDEPEMIAFVP